MEPDVPGREFPASEGFQLREFLLRRVARGLRQLPQELQHFVHCLRHACRECVVRIASEVEQTRGLVTFSEDVLHHNGVVPSTGVGSSIRCASGPRLVERTSQILGLRVGDHGHVRGLIECQNPALVTAVVRTLACLIDEHLVEPAQLGGITDVVGPAVRSVEHVLFELSLQLSELEHHGFELLLACCLEANASEAEIAQRVFDDSTLDGS